MSLPKRLRLFREASARQAERDAAFAASGLGVAGSPADRGWTRATGSNNDAPLRSSSAASPRQDALLEAESLMWQLAVLYPTPEVLVTGMRGMTMYGFSWFDARIWAAAEVHGVGKLLSEDFQHGRHYGRIRVVDPFLNAEGVHELPAMCRVRSG